ncbi:MAG: serine/threonine-protein kinase [Sandaracinus sp.]
MTAAARESDSLATQPAAGDRIDHRYVVESVLGTGAAGIVYAATHEYTGRPVAIKWMHPHVALDVTNAQRFLREARAAASVKHPNVVEILDAGRDRGTYYLVMERLEGELLSAALARHDLGVPAIARIFVTLMRGVAAAHELGIVHRDLKPENVFLCPPSRGRPGGAKVLDFGISKLKRTTSDGGELTAAGVFIGSPYYMAPEQIADSRSVDARADVYAIGVMLYEALGHRVPFDAESLSALFAKVVDTKPTPIEELRPDLPAALCDVVMRAMSASPKSRFPTVREMAEALEPFAQGLRFDPGGDAFDVAWRERGSMIDARFSDLPPRPSDAPSRPSDTPAAPIEISDAASDALERARARSKSDAIPEQPTVIRGRGDESVRTTLASPPPAMPPVAAAPSPRLAPSPAEIRATPTVVAEGLAPAGPASAPALGGSVVTASIARPARTAEPTETFARPPERAAPSRGTLARALAPWIALAVIVAIVMLAIGVSLGRLL